MKKIKVLIVEPEKEAYIKKIDNTLRSLKNEVYGEVKMSDIEDGVIIISNSTAKNEGLPFNRYIKNDIICGTFLLLGCCNGKAFSLSEKMIEKYKEYFKLSKHRHIVENFKSRYRSSSELVKYGYAGG